MNFNPNQFKLSPEQLERRHALALEVAKDPMVISFMETYDCSFEFLEKNVYRFKSWIEDYKRAADATATEIQNDPRAGSYFNLSYNKELNILEETYTLIPLVTDLKKRDAYLKNYLLFDLSSNLRGAHFENLKLDDVTSSYISVAQTLSSFYRSNDTGYYLYGNLGVGKSYLAACVSNFFAKNGQRVVYVHVPSLLNHMKQLFQSPSEMERTLRILRTVPLLVLDDLGAEPITSWSRDEILLSIFNDRLENHRKTIITSNATPEMLLELYKMDSRGHADEIRAARFVDRVQALTKPYEIRGKNRRIRQ